MPWRGRVRTLESLPSDDVHPAQAGEVVSRIAELGIHFRVILTQQWRGASSAGRAWRSCSTAPLAIARRPSRGARFLGRSHAIPVGGTMPSPRASALTRRACVFFDASWKSSQRPRSWMPCYHQGVHLRAVVDALALPRKSGGRASSSLP